LLFLLLLDNKKELGVIMAELALLWRFYLIKTACTKANIIQQFVVFSPTYKAIEAIMRQL
jgi:hypothetical protein